jgi:hypothetical protein
MACRGTALHTSYRQCNNPLMCVYITLIPLPVSSVYTHRQGALYSLKRPTT